MKMIGLLVGLLVMFLIPGCSINHSMPKAFIGYDPKTKSITIESPKDVEITGLTLTYMTNGNISLTIGSYSSKQNVQVVNAIATYNKAMTEAAIKAGEMVIGTAIGIPK